MVDGSGPLWDFSTIASSPNSTHGNDFYRPLVTVANRIDYSLYGLKPWGYHLSNLLFHMAQLSFGLGC